MILPDVNVLTTGMAELARQRLPPLSRDIIVDWLTTQAAHTTLVARNARRVWRLSRHALHVMTGNDPATTKGAEFALWLDAAFLPEPQFVSQVLFYPGLGNLTGLPATAFPAGLTRGGLPIGLQAIGPYLEDRTPIHFAALLASEWRAFQPPPGFE